MAKKNIVNEDMIEVMKNLYNSGLSANAVAKEIGVTKRTVLFHLNKIGVVRKTMRELFLDKKHDIINLHLEGKTVKEICSLCNTKHEQVVKLLEDNGHYTKRRRIYSYDDSIFHNIDTEEKAYWLGFICADGNISDAKGYPNMLSMAIKDREHVEKFAEFIGGEIEMVHESNGYWRIAVNCKEMCEDLVSHGATPRKSLTLKFPTHIKKQLMKHFIRGYFDGDGGICIRERTYKKSPNKHQIVSASVVGTKEFISDLLLYLNTYTGINLVTLYMHGENTYEFQKSGTQAKILLSYMYQDSSIHLDRKYEKFVAVLSSNR